MDSQPDSDGPTSGESVRALVNPFVELLDSFPEEALFLLESHNFDLDAAASIAVIPNHDSNPIAPSPDLPLSQSQSCSPSTSPYRSRSRSRSPSLVRRSGNEVNKGSGSGGLGIRTLADLDKDAGRDDSGSDEFEDVQDYHTGGEKSGMFVLNQTQENSVDSIFEQARQSGALKKPAAQQSSRLKSFTGKGRLLSGDTVESPPQPPLSVTHIVSFWHNGFTVDDGPLRRLDDPANAPFLESIKKSKCPEELTSADDTVNIDLVRRGAIYSEPKRRQPSFQGTGRTLGSSDAGISVSVPEPAKIPASSCSNTQPTTSFMGLMVDDSLPTTSIQLRLADGTRMVSRFNCSHMIRDIRAFIDAFMPVGTRYYHLQTMGFPPKQLTDMDQTIEQAGIANSVVIQKLSMDLSSTYMSN